MYKYQGYGELELELIQTRMIQKPLLWVEVGKTACVLVGICELRLSLPAVDLAPASIQKAIAPRES
jgi:hypothetical protein